MHVILRQKSVIRTANCAILMCGAWVKRWMHGSGPGESVWHCVGSQEECSFLRFYEEIENEEDLSTFVRRFDWQPLPKLGPTHIVLRRRFSKLYFAICFHYWARDCDLELRLRQHDTGYLLRGIKSVLLPLPCCIVRVITSRS